MEGRPSIDTEENCYLRVPGSARPSRRNGLGGRRESGHWRPRTSQSSGRRRAFAGCIATNIYCYINKWRGMPTSREVRLSRRDETLVDLLIETGLSRNIAKTLVFLSKRDETTSVEIEKATGLRQPEVSIAMQELRRRKWVDKRDIKKEGKGRPVHSYRLSVPWADILTQVDREEQAKIDRIEANRKKLKSFA